MQRKPDAHKGDHGTVLVVGGSAEMHGAPIFSALAAEQSGADLIHLVIPRCHAAVARMASLNVQVHPMHGDDLSETDRSPIVRLMATMDAVVIGPGVARSKESLAALRNIIAEATCPLVLDASALQPETLSLLHGKTAVLTPHLGELERMNIAPADIGMTASQYEVIIHMKGPVDRIAKPDGSVIEIPGGNPGLTVGGTGDALAGLIAGLIAQGMAPVDACVTASKVIKRAGDALKQSLGYAYGTQRVIEEIPRILWSMSNDHS